MGYDVNHLKDILQMDQATLKDYLELQLEDNGYKPINKKGFLYAEGNIPILLVAHLDTVHHDKPTIICFSEDMRYKENGNIALGIKESLLIYRLISVILKLKLKIIFKRRLIHLQYVL